MATLRAVVTEDAADAHRATRAFLESDPVQHNLLLTLFAQRITRPEPGRFGYVEQGGEIVGASFQSPLSFHSAITPMPDDAVEPLVDALAAAGPDLCGVLGPAGVASRFAGRWAERLNLPVSPIEGQRLYSLRELQPPADVPGRLRLALEDDVDVVVEWAKGFEDDTGSIVPAAAIMRERIADGLIGIWDDDGPVAMAGYTVPIGGVARVGHVYTPPQHRRRGYAAACTAAVSQVAFDQGARRCVLYTQMSNPQSNAIYRRLGYEPVSEQIRYRFG